MIPTTRQRIHDWADAIGDKYPPRDYTDVYFEDMTNVERLVFGVNWFTLEVENGGLSQYLFNSTGSIANDTCRQLRAANLTQLADLLAQALTVFPDGISPKDDEARQAIMRALPDEKEQFLSECDQQVLPIIRESLKRVVEYVGQEFQP